MRNYLKYTLAILILLTAIICMSGRTALTHIARSTYRSVAPARLSRPIGTFGRSAVTPARVSAFGLPFALFSTSTSKKDDSMGEQYPVKKSDSEWQAILSPEQVGATSSRDHEASKGV